MADCSRTVAEIKRSIQSCDYGSSKETTEFYDRWAQTYEQMSELGFSHFVGVDGSKGMLDQAAGTGLYQDLRLALLGTQGLPAETGAVGQDAVGQDAVGPGAVGPGAVGPGAVGQRVKYPPPVCAVKGSTVTLPCTFTPAKSVDVDGRKVPIEIVRVRWCRNHTICHGSTPSVYDSNSTTNDSRFKYLGDKKGNCTLQITDIRKEDQETFRFRMEADNSGGHWTGHSGVKVSVVDGTRMKINSSSGDGQVRTGESVTLFCSALCTFHQLKVTWFRDDHALPEFGPALRLSSLTAKDSGNYTCGLQTNAKTRSGPYSLRVEGEEGADGGLTLTAGVGAGVGVLLVLVTVILVCFIKRRRSAADQRADGGEEDQKLPDHVYSSVLRRADREAGGQPQESSPALEEVSYASVQFKHKTQNQARAALEAEDATIYSAVASRG